MAEYGKKEHPSHSRRQVENDRRLGNKRLKKQISELHAELDLMNLKVTQQMAELRKHRREPEVKEAGAAPQRCTAQDPECTATRQLVEVEDNHGDREEDEEQLSSHTLSSDSWKASNSSDDDFYYDAMTGEEISLLSDDGHNISCQTECGSINSQAVPSEAPSVSDDDLPTKQSGMKESTEHSLYWDMLSEQDKQEINEAWLWAYEWKRWTEREERRAQHEKNMEKLECIDQHAVATRPKTSGLTDKMKRFGTSVSRLFYPLTSPSYKREKLEEED